MDWGALGCADAPNKQRPAGPGRNEDRPPTGCRLSRGQGFGTRPGRVETTPLPSIQSSAPARGSEADRVPLLCREPPPRQAASQDARHDRGHKGQVPRWGRRIQTGFRGRERSLWAQDLYVHVCRSSSDSQSTKKATLISPLLPRARASVNKNALMIQWFSPKKIRGFFLTRPE